MCTDMERAAKIEAIEACLRGTADRVDLWQLRELALSPGGLVTAELRQRAWPLLTQALTHAHPSTVGDGIKVHPLSPLDLWRIQRDVKQSLWNIQIERPSSEVSPMRLKRPRRVQFAVDFLENKEETDGKGHIYTASNPTSDSEIVRPSTAIPNGDGKKNDVPGGAPSAMAAKVHRRRKASASEQRMVANVMTSCLQRAPADGENRYSYFTGFHDLTTLVLLNLQSLSLTSLLLYVRMCKEQFIRLYNNV
jgi:hypothetical protein